MLQHVIDVFNTPLSDMFLTLAGVGTLGLVVVVALSPLQFEIEQTVFTICRVDTRRSVCEYNIGCTPWWLVFTNQRGTVRLHQKGGKVFARDVRVECSPVGDIFAFEGDTVRSASEIERVLFAKVFP